MVNMADKLLQINKGGQVVNNWLNQSVMDGFFSFTNLTIIFTLGLIGQLRTMR